MHFVLRSQSLIGEVVRQVIICGRQVLREQSCTDWHWFSTCNDPYSLKRKCPACHLDYTKWKRPVLSVDSAIPWAGTLNRTKRSRQVEHKHWSHWFLTPDLMWPTASCSCCPIFSAMKIPGKHEPNKPALPWAALLQWEDRKLILMPIFIYSIINPLSTTPD